MGELIERSHNNMTIVVNYPASGHTPKGFNPLCNFKYSVLVSPTVQVNLGASLTPRALF